MAVSIRGFTVMAAAGEFQAQPDQPSAYQSGLVVVGSCEQVDLFVDSPGPAQHFGEVHVGAVGEVGAVGGVAAEAVKAVHFVSTRRKVGHVKAIPATNRP